MSGDYSARVYTIAKVMARRHVLDALGVVQPDRNWDQEFKMLIERAVERTYPDYFRLANEIDAVVFCSEH